MMASGLQHAHSTKYMIRSWLAVLGLALLVGNSAVWERIATTSWTGQAAPRPVIQPDLLPPVPEMEETEEFEGNQQQARDNWFWFQRAYPFNDIPAGARRLAFEKLPKNRFSANQGGQSWTAIGPRPTTSNFPNNWGITSGRINAVAVSPNDPNLILIGSAGGGIWRSADGGTNFTPVSDNQADLAVGSIAFAPSDPTIVYAGMGDRQGNSYFGTGVLKSTDSGQTWTRVSNASLPSPAITARVVVDAGNPNRVYVALRFVRNTQTNGLQAGGIYLSTDGGVSWTQPLAGIPYDLVANPTTAGTLYAILSRVDTGSNNPAGIYRSTDSGANWTNIYNPGYDSATNMRLAVSPANAQVIVGYMNGSANGTADVRVVVSTDGGANWVNRGSTGIDTDQAFHNFGLALDAGNANTIYINSRDVYKSTDTGQSWANTTNNFTLANQYTPRNAKVHADTHFCFVPPNATGTLYATTDGGLYRSTDGGTTYVSLNQTLSLTQFVGYAIHPTNAAISYGGAQDNGNQRRTANGVGWQEYLGGDGGNCQVDPTNPSVVFAPYTYGIIYRYTNNGDTYNGQVTNAAFQEPASGARIAFYPPITTNYTTSALYLGTWRVFVSTDQGNNWTAPGGATDLTKGNGDTLSALAVSRSNNNVIYTGSSQGRAMVSTNGGANWTDITTGLPDRSITSLWVEYNNPETAYITFSGYGTQHVFRTSNFGANWTAIDGSGGTALPNIPCNAFLRDPLNGSTLLVGTDIGVFRSTDNGATWAAFNNGLPPVPVMKIVTQIATNGGVTGVIQIATYGRGAYQLSAANGCQAIGLTPNTLPGAAVNAPFNQTITANGGTGNLTFTISAGALPAGLTLAANGVLSGTPTTAGTSNFTVQVTDANNCTGTVSYSLTVAAAQTPGAGVNNAATQEGNNQSRRGKSEKAKRTGGNDDGTIMEFVVRLNQPSGQTITMNYATQDGSATAGNDYEATSGTVTFQPGEVEKVIEVLVLDDDEVEPTQDFFVNLTGAVNVTLTDAQGEGMIMDGDVTPDVAQFYPFASVPGKTVTITGSGFAAGTQVFFGGTRLIPAASVTVVNPTTLQVVVPASSNGTGNINGYLTIRSGTQEVNTQKLLANTNNPGNAQGIFPEFILWGDLTGDGLSAQANDVALGRAFLQFQTVPSLRQQMALDVIPANANGSRGNGQLTTTDFTLLRAVSFGQTTF